MPHFWKGHSENKHIQNEVRNSTGIKIWILQIRLARPNSPWLNIPLDAMPRTDLKCKHKKANDPCRDNEDEEPSCVVKKIPLDPGTEDAAIEEESRELHCPEGPGLCGVERDIGQLQCRMSSVHFGFAFWLRIPDIFVSDAYYSSAIVHDSMSEGLTIKHRCNHANETDQCCNCQEIINPELAPLLATRDKS